MTDSSMTVVEGETQTVSIKGVTLTFQPGAKDPWVTDSELARVLGFENSRNLKTTIKRLEKRGELSNLQSRFTLKRQATRHGGARQFQVQEYLLTRKQVWTICQASDAPKAVEVRALMAEVFDAFVVGDLVPVTTTAALAPSQGVTRAEVSALVRDVMRECFAMMGPGASITPYISPTHAKSIRKRINDVARMAANGVKGTIRRLQRQIESMVRTAGRLPPMSPNSRWEYLRIHDLPAVQDAVAHIEAIVKTMKGNGQLDILFPKDKA